LNAAQEINSPGAFMPGLADAWVAAPDVYQFPAVSGFSRYRNSELFRPFRISGTKASRFKLADVRDSRSATFRPIWARDEIPKKYESGVRPRNIIPQKSCGLPSKVFGRLFAAFVHNIQKRRFSLLPEPFWELPRPKNSLL